MSAARIRPAACSSATRSVGKRGTRSITARVASATDSTPPSYVAAGRGAWPDRQIGKSPRACARWSRAESSVNRVAITMRTRQRAVRMELADEHFRLLVESVADYAIYLLEPDGTIRSWNAGAQRLKGYTAAEIVGKSFSRFFSPEDRESGKPAQLLAAALRDGRIEDVGWRIRKDGSQFWASA